MHAQLALQLVHAHAEDARVRLTLSTMLAPSACRAHDVRHDLRLRSWHRVRVAQRAWRAWTEAVRDAQERRLLARLRQHSWRRRRRRTEDTPILVVHHV